MKRIICCCIIIGFLIVKSDQAKSQTRDSLTHQIDFFERKLSVSKIVATTIDSILFNYKQKVYRLLGNLKIGRNDKNTQFEKLVLEKSSGGIMVLKHLAFFPEYLALFLGRLARRGQILFIKVLIKGVLLDTWGLRLTDEFESNKDTSFSTDF